MAADAALLLGLIVLLAYTAQAVTGFGSTVITITLGALILPIPDIMPVAVALNLPFCAWMIWREWRHVDGALLRRDILPLMLTGALAGGACAVWVHDLNLRAPLGVLVIVCALVDLWRVRGGGALQLPPRLRALITLLAGFAQGLYASGGPVLAIAVAGRALHKSVVRASLSVVWLMTNSGLTLSFLLTERYPLEARWHTLYLLPLLPLAIALGNVLHRRVDERQFRVMMDVLLLVAGAALLR